MSILKKIFRSQKVDDIDRLIEEHRKLNQEANEKIDQLLASLDGENGWFKCGCEPVTRKACANAPRPLSNTTCADSNG